MSTPRVLCLGEILFDFLSDQPGLPYDQVTAWTPYPGGAPANVACALTKLGTPGAFIGCVGQDERGNALVDVLAAVGVNIEGVQRHPTAPSRGVYVVRSETGDRSFAGFGDTDTADFADAQLNAAHLPIKLFETADFLVLGTLEMAYLNSREATLQALSLADKFFTKVLLDVNWRPVFWQDEAKALELIQTMMPQADFLKVSDEEAEWLFGTTDPSSIAKQLGDLDGVLVTAGEKGCFYDLAGHQGYLPAFDIAVVDTTGAGDSFVAGFLHQLCQQGVGCIQTAAGAHQVVTYASAVGALTTMQAGAIAAQPTPAAVAEFLQTYGQA